MIRIETRNKPRGALVRDPTIEGHCVRVWKHSPEDIALQIWSGKRYLMVTLYPGEAREIADALQVEAYRVEEGKKDIRAKSADEIVAATLTKWGGE